MDSNDLKLHEYFNCCVNYSVIQKTSSLFLPSYDVMVLFFILANILMNAYEYNLMKADGTSILFIFWEYYQPNQETVPLTIAARCLAKILTGWTG